MCTDPDMAFGPPSSLSLRVTDQFAVNSDPKASFLRASAHGAERVNGLYRQYQRDEGGGWVTNFLETFVKYVFFLGLQHWNLCQHRS